MNFELKIVTFFQMAITFIVFFAVIVDPEASFNKNNNVQYVVLFRNILFLYVTAIAPLR